MSATEALIEAFGHAARILRSPEVSTTAWFASRPAGEGSRTSRRYKGRFLPGTGLAAGELVLDEVTGKRYLVLRAVPVMRFGEVTEIAAQLLLAETQVTFRRLTRTYSSQGLVTAESWTDTGPATYVLAEFITAGLRQADPGLLPSTVMRLYCSATADVKPPDDPALVGPDRAVIGGKAYQVNAVDPVGLPGLYLVQLAYDDRG